MTTAKVQHFFDPATATFSYVVSDPTSQQCAIIDPVLDFDFYSGRTSSHSAEHILSYINNQQLTVAWILETHAHADHLTAAQYLQQQVGGLIAIGEHIRQVLEFWVPLFNIGHDTPLDGSQFDRLWQDGDCFHIGSIAVSVMHTPGHTPACVSYVIEDMAFVGDTLFMPYVGTARTDFPGGDAGILYDSIMRLYQLPDSTQLMMCHDYPPQGQKQGHCVSVAEQKLNNIIISQGISKQDFVSQRQAKDRGKAVPLLLLPSIQVNLRAGAFGQADSKGSHYIKIPLNKI